MSVYNRISNDDNINFDDRKKIMAEFETVKRGASNHAEAFISKWNKYPDFLEYFEKK